MYKTRQERPYRPPLPGSDSRRGGMVLSAVGAACMAAPTARTGHSRAKTAVCGILPCSEAASAALENRRVDVTRCDSTVPREAMKGQGVPDRTFWWNATACAMPLPTMHAAGPKGDRGPQPPARFGDFSAVKSPPPEAAQPAQPPQLPPEAASRPGRAMRAPTESVRYRGRRGIAGQRAAASRPYGEDGARRKAQVGGPM